MAPHLVQPGVGRSYPVAGGVPPNTLRLALDNHYRIFRPLSSIVHPAAYACSISSSDAIYCLPIFRQRGVALPPHAGGKREHVEGRNPSTPPKSERPKILP